MLNTLDNIVVRIARFDYAAWKTQRNDPAERGIDTRSGWHNRRSLRIGTSSERASLLRPGRASGTDRRYLDGGGRSFWGPWGTVAFLMNVPEYSSARGHGADIPEHDDANPRSHLPPYGHESR